MNSSRQLLLGVGVFFGGTILLYAMLQMEGSPHTSTDKLAEIRSQTAPTSTPTDTSKPVNSGMLTADIETETRILAEKRRERESRVTELDKRAKTFLEEQERAELLAMEKARLENQKYRNNAAEPIGDEQLTTANSQSEPTAQSSIITKPVVTARNTQPVNADNAAASQLKLQETKLAQQIAKQNQLKTAKTTATNATNATKNSETKVNSSATPTATPKPQTVRTESQTYTVQAGDGLIRLARRYNVPLDSLLKANGLTRDTSLVVGQKVIIPSSKQAEKLTLAAKNSSNSQVKAPVKAAETKPTPSPSPKADAAKTGQEAAKASATPGEHDVGPGDGLIKLARQYNVPVTALAAANNISTNASLHVGQTLKIPSRSQVARLEREAAQQQAAQAAKQEAQTRLIEARRKAKAADAGTQESFGVQVALADSQEKADAVVKQMQAAGYKATTSQTSRGVRVIVGPEKGKEAALALKDKLNADSKANVDGAWVLGWR